MPILSHYPGFESEDELFEDEEERVEDDGLWRSSGGEARGRDEEDYQEDYPEPQDRPEALYDDFDR